MNSSQNREIETIECLRQIRNYEIREILSLFPERGYIIEIGAGLGHQAAVLNAMGYKVLALDIPNQFNSNRKVFPVIDYDGVFLPLRNQSVTCVYTSNVLEHVKDLKLFFAELNRILKPNGYSIHVVPTPIWKIFNLIAYPLAAIKTCIEVLKYEAGPIRKAVGILKKLAGNLLLMAKAHGVRGNTISEIFLYTNRGWRKVVSKNGWEVVYARSLNIFYTGHNILGLRLSIPMRRVIGKLIGSSTKVLIVAPKSNDDYLLFGFR